MNDICKMIWYNKKLQNAYGFVWIIYCYPLVMIIQNAIFPIFLKNTEIQIGGKLWVWLQK